MNASIGAGGCNTAEDAERAISAASEELLEEGYQVLRIVLLDDAIADIQHIQKYLPRLSKSQATGEKFPLGLVHQCRKLALLLGTIGRLRPELLA